MVSLIKSISEPCSGCGQLITTGQKFARLNEGQESHRVHIGCLKCFGCDVTIARYTYREGNYYCDTCGEGCAKCLKLIKVGQPYLKYTSNGVTNRYHSECFTCGRCHKPVKSFETRNGINSQLLNPFLRLFRSAIVR